MQFTIESVGCSGTCEHSAAYPRQTLHALSKQQSSVLKLSNKAYLLAHHLPLFIFNLLYFVHAGNRKSCRTLALSKRISQQKNVALPAAVTKVLFASQVAAVAVGVAVAAVAAAGVASIPS